MVQGSAFGLGPAFRISYATKTTDLEDAQNIQRFAAICDRRTRWRRAGLDPAIHLRRMLRRSMDAQVKPAHA